LITKPPQHNALAVVCDGIGGHEGGNVASNLAIETIQKQVKELTSVADDNIDPSMLLSDLERAVATANDKISQRNDSEHRQGRQRMGTTIVMALPIAHEIYITHVGDSRAYWITRHSCHQVTLDDDVASREVRLGYALYREALQHSGSGSLVQALGMSKSTSLHPTSQRFIVDEDAVFLLTSDGLSDFDRVEESWETEILPLLSGKTSIENVAQRLIEIANTKNGHDNVTIALIHYNVKYSEPDIRISSPTPFSSQPPPSTIQRTLDNLSPNWVIQANSSITLNNQPFSAESFFQVIEKKTNPNNGNNPEVRLRLCEKSNPALETSKIVQVNFSELQDLAKDISILQSDQPSPCQ
jgi:protein phosphatase